MNKKQLFKGLIIFFATLFIGFGITALSFNLFDTLTINQMRLLFTFDFLALFSIGSIVYIFKENKETQRKKEQEFNKRHERRVNERNEEMREIINFINNSNFAA